MAIIFRVLYNNKDWQAKCTYPGKDRKCLLCLEKNVDIIPPGPDDSICSGDCWEQHLCKDYKWGCTPKGRVFGNRAYPGVKVFFVFKQPDGEYTLWGRTTVKEVDKSVVEEEGGFSFIHFDAFEPLPRDKWVEDLSDIDLVGASWRIGRYRFIERNREAVLDHLIDGDTDYPRSEIVIPNKDSFYPGGINVNLAPAIKNKLDKIALEEGRSIEEVIREAIAEWLKGRA